MITCTVQLIPPYSGIRYWVFITSDSVNHLGPSVAESNICTCTAVNLGSAMVQQLVHLSLSPLWCPSLLECWWLLSSATFQGGPQGHHKNQVHMLILPLCMRWALI